MSHREVARRPRVGGEWIGHEAARVNAPRGVAYTVFWTPVAGIAVLLIVWLAARAQYYQVLREDYPVEWLEFALCLLTSVVAALAVGRLARRRELLLAAVLLAVALGTLVLAGEEISWGQRVFAWGTPGELAAVNQQAELNVHNIEAAGLPVQSLFKIFSFLLALTGLALTLLPRGPWAHFRTRRWQAWAPPLFTVPGFALMVVYRPAMLIPVDLSALIRLQEWIEASLYVSLTAAVACVFVRSSSAAAAPTAGAGRMEPAPDPLAAGAAWRVVAVIGVLVGVLTAVFAVLTAYHGIVPANAFFLP